jgi:S1-C subfamily serine protease
MHLRRTMVAALVCVSVVALTTMSRGDDDTKKNERPFLGIRMMPDESAAGMTVQEVVPNSPAEKAGIKNGDIVLKIGKTDLKDPENVREAMRDHKPGDKVTVHIKRDGKEQDIEVTLGTMPKDFGQPREEREQKK